MAIAAPVSASRPEQSSQMVDFARLLRGIDIPSCPEVLAALKAEMQAASPNPVRIGRLISQDVALSAGLLKIANSGLFAPARQVTTMADALALLGIGQAFQWIIKELLQQAIAAGSARRFERFWDSAAYTAAICAQLAGSVSGTTRQAAWDFGLFRDCGIPILSARFPDYGETLRQANDETRHSFTRVEDLRHGSNHAVVGCLMARTWGLAEAVSEAILCHHDYQVLERDSGVGSEVQTLVALHVLAEQVVALHLGREAPNEWRKGHQTAAAFLGLSRAGVADLVDEVRSQIDRRRVAG
ncbi:MAG TPA: HDOD domain-containing protein [Rhodocyclaceae bacterium]